MHPHRPAKGQSTRDIQPTQEMRTFVASSSFALATHRLRLSSTLSSHAPTGMGPHHHAASSHLTIFGQPRQSILGKSNLRLTKAQNANSIISPQTYAKLSDRLQNKTSNMGRSGMSPVFTPALDATPELEGQKSLKDLESFALPKQRRNVLLHVASFILIMECAERLCYYGLSGSVRTYFVNFLGYGSAQASALTNTMSSLIYLTPFLGAYVADAKLGRHKTILLFGFIYVAGVVLMTISSWPTWNIKWLFILSLFGLIALGSGGIKPNVITMGGDQFNLHDEDEKEQQKHYFNYFYWVINIGAAVAFGFLAQVATNGIGSIPADYGFFTSFAIASGAWLIAIAVYIIGTPRYIKKPPQGSQVINFMKSFLMCARYSFKAMLVALSVFITLVGVILNIIAAFTDTDGQSNVVSYVTAAMFVIGLFGMAFLTVNNDYMEKSPDFQSEDGRQRIETEKHFMALICPIAFSVVFWTVYSQMSSNMYQIACQMDLMIGSGQLNGSVLNLGDCIAIIIFIPILDRFGYPFVEKLKGSAFTPLQKMFVGFFVAGSAMISTAIIENYRKAAPVLYDMPTSNCAAAGVHMSDISVAWMIIPYFLIGLAECLISVSMYELCYKQSPTHLKSTANAFQLYSTSIASGVSSVITLLFSPFITANLNDGDIQYLFYFLTGLCVVTAIVFALTVKNFVYIIQTDDEDEFDVRTSCASRISFDVVN